MSAEIITAVKGKARETAKLFVDEFQEPLDPSQTDWDAVAWGEDKQIVLETDETADPDDYWEIYQRTLTEETERINDNDFKSYNLDLVSFIQ